MSKSGLILEGLHAMHEGDNIVSDSRLINVYKKVKISKQFPKFFKEIEKLEPKISDIYLDSRDLGESWIFITKLSPKDIKSMLMKDFDLGVDDISVEDKNSKTFYINVKKDFIQVTVSNVKGNDIEYLAIQPKDGFKAVEVYLEF